MGEKSTILQMQRVLFSATDPNIITNISADQTTITASNISEQTFQYLSMATNNPSYTNGYLYLTDIQVYLNNDVFPTMIYGLYPIVYERMSYSDTSAFISGANSNQPFINGFQGGISIGQLVDQLSALSRSTPDTYGKVKKFVLVMDPVTSVVVAPGNKPSNNNSYNNKNHNGQYSISGGNGSN